MKAPIKRNLTVAKNNNSASAKMNIYKVGRREVLNGCKGNGNRGSRLVLGFNFKIASGVVNEGYIHLVF